VKRLAGFVLLLSACSSSETTVQRSMTIDEVVRLAKAGVGSKTLVAMIETSQIRHAPLMPDDLVSLKEKGLDDEVLAALVKATTPKPAAARDAPPPSYYYYRGPAYAPYW
jgi:hypothetical protein